MLEFAFWTTQELADAIRYGRLSAREVVQACLDRIEALNPRLNAIVTLDADEALRQATRADEVQANGESLGPLHGVPFTLKDCLETAGMRTTAGHNPLAEFVPKEDSTVAARLKSAGAILLGKTNVPPLAMSLQTNNEIFGRTNNPWNLARTVGGSSGGAAAAIAAGLTPFDVGSDLAGSVRIPAHYCGLFGLKPTANRIPVAGHIPPLPGVPRFDRHLMTVGPLARSSGDLALIAGLLAGPDGRDTEVPPAPWIDAPRRVPDSLKIAFLPVFPGVPTSRAVSKAVTSTAEALANAGAGTEERDPGVPAAELGAVWRDYFQLAAAAMMELSSTAMPVKPPYGPPPALAAWLRVLDRRDGLIRAIDGLLEDFDAFLCPAVIATAFEHSNPGSPFPVDGEMVESRFVDHYLVPFNMTGHPAVTIPAGPAEDGLPVGVQLVGRRWGDEALLAVADAVSAVIGGFSPPPNYA